MCLSHRPLRAMSRGDLRVSRIGGRTATSECLAARARHAEFQYVVHASVLGRGKQRQPGPAPRQPAQARDAKGPPGQLPRVGGRSPGRPDRRLPRPEVGERGASVTQLGKRPAFLALTHRFS